MPGVRVVAWALEHAYYGGESAHGSITAGDGVLTAADGTFMYPGVVQCYEFRIDTDAWYLAEESARWRDGTEPVIVVRPRAAVAGRVVDESGKGVPFAEVWGGARGRIERAHHTRADAGGRFLLPGLAVGWPDLEVKGKAGALRGKMNVEGDSGSDIADLTLRLVRTRFVSGRLVDGSGCPVAGVRVSLDWREEREDHTLLCSRSDVSDEGGSFVVADLPERELELDFRAGGLDADPSGAVVPTWRAWTWARSRSGRHRRVPSPCASSMSTAHRSRPRSSMESLLTRRVSVR